MLIAQSILKGITRLAADMDKHWDSERRTTFGQPESNFGLFTLDLISGDLPKLTRVGTVGT